MHSCSSTNTQYLSKQSHFSNKIDCANVIFLFPQVVLYQSVLAIAHQPQYLATQGKPLLVSHMYIYMYLKKNTAHLEGQFDVARVLEFEQLHCLVVNASIWVIFLHGEGIEA